MTAQTWPMVKLGDVANINPPAPQHLPHDTIVSFLPMKNVSEDGSLVLDECPYNGTKKGYTSLKKQDIIVAKITPCFENKKIAIAHIPNKYGFGSTEFHVIRCSEKLNNRFAFYFLRQDRINKLGQEYMTGSAGQKRIPQTFLKDLLIPLPPLSEQKRIAAILDKAYDVCQLRRHALKKLDVLGEAIFHDMFKSKQHTPSTHPYYQLGKISITINYGLTASAVFSDCNGPLFLRITDIQHNNIIWENVPRCHASPQEVEKFSLREGDIVFSRTGATTGKSIKIKKIPECCLFASYLIRITPNPKVNSTYLAAFFQTTQYWNQVHLMSSGTGQPGINASKLKKLQIPLPPLAEQERFAARIAKLEALQKHHRQALAKQEMLFQSLQQRAFRGEL